MIELGFWARALCRPVLQAGPAGPQALRFHLTSPDVKADSTIALQHVHPGCNGQNVSPTLAWHNPPSGTRSFALTVYDPDAPTGSGWWHWVVFNLPQTATGLARGAGNPGSGGLPASAIQSRNDYGEVGYGGPCPPPGKPHRYAFTVYALKVGHLDLKAESSCAMVGFMINANKIDQASFTAMYGR